MLLEKNELSDLICDRAARDSTFRPNQILQIQRY